MSPRRRKVLLAVAAVGIVATCAVLWLAQPRNLAPLVLAQAERVLGLQISAEGESEYRLRGTPQIVLRKVTARGPGMPEPLLRADRVLVAVPWSTLLARGSDLTMTRIELDSPVVDLQALRTWLAARPPSSAPVPELTRGLGITGGRLVGSGWTLHDVEADVPLYDAAKAFGATIRGRYRSPGLAMPFDVALSMQRPGFDSPLGLAGDITPASSGWSAPTRFRLSGVLRDKGALHLERAVLGAGVRYVAGATQMDFEIGLAGPMRVDADGVTLDPLALSLRGQGVVPELTAQGALRAGDELVLGLDGELAQWPRAWPALPAPLGSQPGAFEFRIRYTGASDLSAIASLRLRRAATHFDARFRLREIAGWMQAEPQSPLPPLTGSLATPRLEISGAVLEGVQVQLQDPDMPAEEAIP